MSFAEPTTAPLRTIIRNVTGKAQSAVTAFFRSGPWPGPPTGEAAGKIQQCLRDHTKKLPFVDSTGVAHWPEGPKKRRNDRAHDIVDTGVFIGSRVATLFNAWHVQCLRDGKPGGLGGNMPTQRVEQFFREARQSVISTELARNRIQPTPHQQSAALRIPGLS